MRKELKKIMPTGRQIFTAVVGRIGVKNNYHGFPEETLILHNLKNTEGKILTDHIWVNKSKNTTILFDIASQGLTNQIVTFSGRVMKYTKTDIYDGMNFRSKRIDYSIGYIKDILVHFENPENSKANAINVPLGDIKSLAFQAKGR